MRNGFIAGAPSESQTYEYAKTILSLMTREKHPRGKVLIIGGGIANFTNVASTFKGIVRALTDYQHKITKNGIKIFVRRGGPNFQEGLRLMRETGNKLGLVMHVFGPETHMTAIVGMGLGSRPIPKADVSNPTSLLATVSCGGMARGWSLSVLYICVNFFLPQLFFIFSCSTFSISCSTFSISFSTFSFAFAAFSISSFSAFTVLCPALLPVLLHKLHE